MLRRHRPTTSPRRPTSRPPSKDSPEAQYADPLPYAQPLLKDLSGYAPYTPEEYNWQDPFEGYEPPFDNTELFVDLIENGVRANLPDWMNWFAAMGLMVTIVWLYLELLRLISKLRD